MIAVVRDRPLGVGNACWRPAQDHGLHLAKNGLRWYQIAGRSADLRNAESVTVDSGYRVRETEDTRLTRRLA
jgi:hypothetical protein